MDLGLADATAACCGELPDYTGIDALYEPPEHPDLHIDTGESTAEEAGMSS